MRTLVAAFAAALIASSIPAATAQDGPARETLAAPEPQSRTERLDALFAELQAADSETVARGAEEGILRIWLESGSPTVDLLMKWTLEAMDAENYPLALDFLDRITSLKPDYVEGWNKRATVHYLVDDYGKSLADLERTLALEPRHFGALAGLGTILRELGQDARALAAYKEALVYDPYMENVQEAIDDLNEENGGQDI